MTKQEFVGLLKERLLRAGLSEAEVAGKCKTVLAGFDRMSDEDAQKCYTSANIDMLVQRICVQKGTSEKKSAAFTAPKEEVQSSTAPSEKTAVDRSASTELSGGALPSDEGETAPKPTMVMNRTEKSGATASADLTGSAETSGASSEVIYVSRAFSDNSVNGRKRRHQIDDSIMSEGSKHPKLLLALILLLSAPAILFALLLILGISLGLAVCMAGAILLLVCVIAAVVCGGSLLSAAGLIYGISQFISAPKYIGIYEIGFAMMIAGATIFISVVLYNIAVRLIPLLYRLIGKGLKFLYKNAKKWAIIAWKGCENL